MPGINADQLGELAKLANSLVWKNPDLNVLRPELMDQYPSIVHALQDSLLGSHRRGRLILPDLEAMGNTTVGLFSDYAGESSGNYYTYSFLTCAWLATGVFQERMGKVREETKLGNKEIAFKDFRMGQMRRALPDYLNLLDNFVPGLLLTVVIDKKLTSLFGVNERSTQRELAKVLSENGLGDWKPHVAEKLVRIVHIGAFLAALLGSPGQKLFWMTDNDAICANQSQHEQALALFARVLPLYTPPKLSFQHFGGAAPFAERHLMTLDLLSATDIVASSVEHYLTKRDNEGPVNFNVNAGAEQVLQWLAHDGLGLKKATIIIRPVEGGIQSANLEFGLVSPTKHATYIPVIV